ncbi:MAG: YncE family protein [Dongiaceae bacterium]
MRRTIGLARAVIAAAMLAAASPAAAGGGLALVINSNDDSISLIDTARLVETARVPIGREPHHLMLTPDRGELLVANAVGNELVALDPLTGTVKRRITGISDPYQIGFSPDGQWFVANSDRLGRVDIYRYHQGAFTLARRIPTPTNPSHMAFSADSRIVFVSLQGTGKLAAIELSTQQILWELPVGDTPAGVWRTADDRYVLVGIMSTDHVAVVDWRKPAIVGTIVTGDGAHNIFPMTSDPERILVSNRVANSISIVDVLRLQTIETFPCPGGPDDMQLSADGSELWVTSRWIRKVTVIDMRTKAIKAQIRVGRSPHGIYLSDRLAAERGS